MARIPLTIDPQYCPTWTFWEGIRELIQNAKDAEEYDDYPMEIDHFPRTDKLVISSVGAVLDPKLLLLLGASTKRGTEQRGQFGEGFAIGVLALLREGHPVTVYNGEEVWRPAIEKPDEGHPFAGTDLLVFNTRALQKARDKFTVEVENVSREVWEATRKLFLFLEAPPADQAVKIDDYNTVLLGERYKTMVYARGIFVSKVEDLECGYDISNVKLDRDRGMVDAWDLRWRLSDIINRAHDLYPEKFKAAIYTMVKEDKAESKQLDYHADEKLLKSLKEEFELEHGVGTVPVETMEQSRELEAMGAKTAVVNKTLSALLKKVGMSASDSKVMLSTAVKNRYSFSQLTDEEKKNLDWVDRLCKGREYVIIDFADDHVSCRSIDDGTKIGVGRWILSLRPRYIVETLLSQDCVTNGRKPESILLELMFPTNGVPEAKATPPAPPVGERQYSEET